MKKTLYSIGILVWLAFFSACNMATPENYFDRVVLNANGFAYFGGEGAMRILSMPPAKLKEGSTTETVQMTRKEMVEMSITQMEQNLEKIKKLPDDNEAREMVQTSLRLYDIVLPAYKNEYREMAKLFDAGAPKEQIEALAQRIDEKYYKDYEQVFTKLTELGKVYAGKHDIKVNWGR
ncbi:hypothetical protein [Taibaiella helva]|uniref:hypothetical protein n=1 Tax=Taibaiella helva TaxID=2301235 RepID=UPI000E56DE94|nr:hypothetical protein [Taibaiella helva]